MRTAAPTRALNALLFCALALVAVLAWDVAYCLLYGRFELISHGALLGIPGLVWLLVFPALLCLALAYVTGQWREPKASAVQAGVFILCLAAPALMIFPAFAFMCFAFASCFGD
ncbi:MAG TPA: hypothetical protein VHZ78_02430 [Rhizomicrobium sp.]|jgi:hypothetical protein|nr:hypothetical protein [Rhizomicrobium sp.]